MGVAGEEPLGDVFGGGAVWLGECDATADLGAFSNRWAAELDPISSGAGRAMGLISPRVTVRPPYC